MSSFSFDMRTLSVVSMLVSVVLGITLLMIWRTHKTYPGFGLWAAGYVSAIPAFMLIALRGMIPDVLSIVVANLLILGSSILFLEGVRRFCGLTGRWMLSLSLLILPGVLNSYFTFVSNDTGMRIVIFSLFAAAIFGQASWILIRKAPPDRRFSFLFTGCLFAAHTLFLLLRAGLTCLNVVPADFLAPSPVQSLTFLCTIPVSIAWALGFIMLNSERLEMDLKKAQVDLQRLAATDSLTGIANNRSFFEAGEREIQRVRRYGRPLSVLMIDLDHFKEVNDTYGHAAGDRMLVEGTAIIRKLLRDIDVFGRIGGEEFAILLPETDLAGGMATAERLRAAIERTTIDAGNQALKVTISIGVALLAREDRGLEAVLKRADDAMYEAKRRGRNRVVADPTLPAPAGAVDVVRR